MMGDPMDAPWEEEGEGEAEGDYDGGHQAERQEGGQPPQHGLPLHTKLLLGFIKGPLGGDVVSDHPGDGVISVVSW